MNNQEKKLVYIAHPVGGDVQNNIKKILQICRHIHLADDNCVPFAPYVVSLQYLNDAISGEREIGMSADWEYFKRKVMDELWLCGDRISEGMRLEIEQAREYDIPIICYNPELKWLL